MATRAFTPPLRVSPELRSLIEAFLDWARVERGFSAETIETYRRGIGRFVTEAGVQTVQEVSAIGVVTVKRHLMNRGCSASYIAIIVLGLRCFLTYCKDVCHLEVLDPKSVVPLGAPLRK